jgi:protein SCO1/2
MRRFAVMALTLALAYSLAVRAETQVPGLKGEVGIEQRLGQQVPLDLLFQDEEAEPVRLGECFKGKPVVLVFAYFRCPMLCTQVLNGLAESLRGMPLRVGDDFQVVTVSFDPRETPELAKAKKANYVASIERPGQPHAAEGWHFLTGGQHSIDRLTDAAGFRFAYDPRLDQFAHASGILVLTPEGKISRYFYGVDYPARDLRLALVEASGNRIGSPVDRVLLLCYEYDPASGRYTATVMRLVRLAGAGTVVALTGLVLFLWRRERRKAVLL